MNSGSEISEQDIKDMDKKDFRKEFPSGWMTVSRYETLVLIIDTLLESPTNREFTPQELADRAGSTKKSVERRIPSLVELGVLKKLESDREEPRYTLNSKSPITRKLHELNDTVNWVKNGEIPQSIQERPPREYLDDLTEESDSSRYKGPMDTGSTGRSGSGFSPANGITG